MGQSNNKAQKPNRVTGRKHGWISDSKNKEKRTGARMPGFSFGFGRNRVKRIHLKPEEAEPAGFQPETVRNQSKFSQIFLCCLSSPDDHLDVIQTERISNASCETINQYKVTGVVDGMSPLSENQEQKSLSLCHPLHTNSGFSKENHLTVLTKAEEATHASPKKPENLSNRFNDGFFENDGWSVWSEEDVDDESAALSYPGMLNNCSWERDMATEQMDGDKISSATYDITSLDASPEKPEELSKRSSDGFLENDSWSVMSEGTSVWSEEEEGEEDESATLSSPGVLSNRSWGKGDMGTEQIDLDKISNANYDINSLDALLDEVEEMLAQKQKCKNLPLDHPQNTNNSFSKDNDLTVLTEAEEDSSASQTQEKPEEPSKSFNDGFFENDGWSVQPEEDNDDDSAALRYPGILSNCSWEKGDMATDQINKISNASFDINGLDALLDEVEKMLGQKENVVEEVKLQVKPSRKNNIMDDEIRRTIAEILFAEVDEVPEKQENLNALGRMKLSNCFTLKSLI